MLTGLKTYLGGYGLILTGIGGMLTGKIGPVEGFGMVATGLSIVGARSFGQKVLDTLQAVKK